MRTVLILNPAAGLSSLADSPETVAGSESPEEVILAALHPYSIEPEIWYTTPDDPGKGLACKAADEHYDLVIAAGGDGTIHAVASGLIKRDSTLGIIPMGTMNNLAHSLGIPLSIEAACAVIGKSTTRTLDIGLINGQTFLEVAGVGFEASLFPAAEEIKKQGLVSTLRGVVQGLITLSTFKTTRLKISFDDKNMRPYDAIQVTICNAPYYGVHFQVASDILMDDGLLDVFIYKHFNKFEYIQHAISISQGRRVYQPKIIHRRVKSLRITSSEPLDIHADGLPHGRTPATINVAAGALHVCVPTANGPGIKDDSPIDGRTILQVGNKQR
ncbi:MAG: diacylglycerol/lipid kinase family protein [Ktedonobacteraceae bacterium]